MIQIFFISCETGCWVIEWTPTESCQLFAKVVWPVLISHRVKLLQLFFNCVIWDSWIYFFFTALEFNYFNDSFKRNENQNIQYKIILSSKTVLVFTASFFILCWICSKPLPILFSFSPPKYVCNFFLIIRWTSDHIF